MAEKKRVTDRELLIRIDERLQNLEDNTEKKLTSILEQAIKTNGRVGSLETTRERLKGAWAVLILIAAATGSITAIIVNYIAG